MRDILERWVSSIMLMSLNAIFITIKNFVIKLRKNKKLVIISSSIILLTLFVSLFLVAIAFFGGKHNIIHVFEVMFSSKLISNSNSFEDKEIVRSIWIILAMVVGGMGLAVTGAIAQSLTKNPLADASTLGTINATIFLLVISFSIGWIAFYAQYIFAVIGGIVAALLLLSILIFSKGKLTKTKFILMGLSISIAFKAVSFFFWSQDKGIGSAYSSYLMGGSEKIYGSQTYMPSPWITLLIATVLIITGIIIALINSKGMTVTELGDDKARGLGISTTRVRVLNIIALILIVPSSVMIVGNLAFVGLIATHVVRIGFKTRDYKKLIPIVIVTGMTIALLGLVLNILVPRMNSSIWTTIIGAPMLIYLGWRKL